MDYIELTVKLKDPELHRDLLISELGDIGFESFIETEEGFQAYIREPEFSEDTLSGIRFFSDPDFAVSYSLNTIPSRNWNAEWESSFQPVTVHDQLRIRASFHQPDPSFKLEIIIDPEMSFGTGHHETTWLMAEAILGMNFKNRSVLDMGCGTAVLAILTSMLGADPILAVDIEEGAVQNSRTNCSLNSIHNIELLQGTATVLADRHFHVILANINKNVLLADLPEFSKRLIPGGELLLSGFFDTDASTITEKAVATGLTLIRKNLRNQWCLLHFEKQLPPAVTS